MNKKCIYKPSTTGQPATIKSCTIKLFYKYPFKNIRFPHRGSSMKQPWPAQLLCGIGKCRWCVSSIACVHSETYGTLF